jgi:hypothetical protein
MPLLQSGSRASLLNRVPVTRLARQAELCPPKAPADGAPAAEDADRATVTAARGRRNSRVGDAATAEARAGALVGRPDLAQDSLADLRFRQRELKQQAKRVKKELKNKQRQKQRIMRRVSSLDTRDIVQVLLDRGLCLRDAQAAAAEAEGGSAAASPVSAAGTPVGGGASASSAPAAVPVQQGAAASSALPATPPPPATSQPKLALQNAPATEQ